MYFGTIAKLPNNKPNYIIRRLFKMKKLRINITRYDKQYVKTHVCINFIDIFRSDLHGIVWLYFYVNYQSIIYFSYRILIDRIFVLYLCFSIVLCFY
jgi:hypothetical protein